MQILINPSVTGTGRQIPGGFGSWKGQGPALGWVFGVSVTRVALIIHQSVVSLHWASGGKITAGELISTTDLSAPASKTNRIRNSPAQDDIATSLWDQAGQTLSAPGLGGLCPAEIFPFPRSQRHPEGSRELLHHRAITINSNYTSSLAAELCKNNKEARKKKKRHNQKTTSEKAEERLLQCR